MLHDLQEKYSEKRKKAIEIYENIFELIEEEDAKTVAIPIIGFGDIE